jgi:hypothetical protein
MDNTKYYCELVEDSIANRNYVTTFEDYSTKVTSNAFKNKEMYSSYFKFGKDFQEYVEKKWFSKRIQWYCLFRFYYIRY